MRVCLCVWKVEGTFRVRKPPVLLGYMYESRSAQTDTMTEAATPQDSENTYVTLFVTIEPQLAAPEPFREKVCTACCILSNYLLVVSKSVLYQCVTVLRFFCKSTCNSFYISHYVAIPCMLIYLPAAQPSILHCLESVCFVFPCNFDICQPIFIISDWHNARNFHQEDV